MKRLLTAVVLTFAASASCMLDLKGMPSTSSDNQAATTTGSGGAGGAPSTSTATGSSTGAGGSLFTWRRKLELDSGVDTTLSNFSMLVLLEKDQRIEYSHTQNQGEDLRFTDDQHNVLDHEIERWDEGGTSVVWVRIPTLKPNASPLPAIWMYYGNNKAADGQNVHGVWSDGYQGVWHLGEGGDDLSDSSGKTPSPRGQRHRELPGAHDTFGEDRPSCVLPGGQEPLQRRHRRGAHCGHEPLRQVVRRAEQVDEGHPGEVRPGRDLRWTLGCALIALSSDMRKELRRFHAERLFVLQRLVQASAPSQEITMRRHAFLTLLSALTLLNCSSDPATGTLGTGGTGGTSDTRG